MPRFKSIMPWGMRIAFAILFFIAWRGEGLLLSWLAGTRLAAAAIDNVHLDSFWTRLAPVASFVSDGFSFIGTTLANAFQSLPLSIRESPAIGLIGAGATHVAEFFGIAAAGSFFAAILALVVQLVRILIALNIAGWLYNVGRRVLQYIGFVLTAPVRFYGERENDEQSSAGAVVTPIDKHVTRRREYVEFLSSHVDRIGIILPGGGARGVYQAGALKAIYDFLRDYNALGKVKMIAATSIGAWNAMFWLADLMESKDAAVSLETWWKQTRVSQMLDFPWLWAPFVSESRFRTGPWRERFFNLFQKRMEPLFVGAPAMHFYFTRVDVALGILGYATNWSGIRQVTEKLGLDKQDGYRFVDVIEADGDEVKRTADAMFASLGQAPLFQGRWGKVMFEDGGALDPIPLRFAAPLEKCDLVFVLPTQGSLELRGHRRDDRLRRLAQMQQIALERAALKHADTINRVAERFERLQFGAETIAASGGAVGVAADAVGGVREEIDEFTHAYKRLYLFTACPTGSMEVAGDGFRHQSEMSNAFDLMYEQTRLELQHRLFENVEPEDAQIVMIDSILGSDGKPVKPTYRRASQF